MSGDRDGCAVWLLAHGFGTSSMQPFSCTPCAGGPWCSLVVLVLPTHLAVSVSREDPFLPRPLVEVDGGILI